MSQAERIKNLKSKFAPIKESFNKFIGKPDEIENFIRPLAVYSKENYQIADVNELLSKYELKLLGMGIHQRVYRIVGTNWIVKEGRWDASIDIAFGQKLKFPSGIFDWVFRRLGGQPINPHLWRVLDEYRIYLEFCQYLGYFSSDDVYYHPNREMMFLTQQNIRKSLKLFKPEVEKEYGLYLNGKLDGIFDSEIQTINFLPKEYLLIGNSISKENGNKVTALIFQEFVEGKSLRDVPSKELSRNHRHQLILMAYLILLMHMQIRLLPDTRPRYHMFEAYDWLTKTDNIIVTKDKLAFIDTRWFWDTKGNILKKGFIIPKLTIRKCKSTLLNLLKDHYD